MGLLQTTRPTRWMGIEALIAYYRPQIEMYQKFWEDISGEGVKETGLYFVDGGKWVIVMICSLK